MNSKVDSVFSPAVLRYPVIAYVKINHRIHGFEFVRECESYQVSGF